MAASAPHGSPTLLLVPTDLERAGLADLGGFDPGLAIEAACGFGPVAAAARASALLAELRPARVLLVGIAGSYDLEANPVGSAARFDAVAIEGIGAGEGGELRPPSALGFPQLPARPGEAAVFERIELARSRAGTPSCALLLSTCSVAASPVEADARRRRHPDAAAEDMEGFGVALACRLFGTPVCIVRGISNAAGDRDPARWRIPAGLASARELALAILRSGEPWTAAS